MFPGGGVQYPGAGQDLFDTEPVFRDAVNRCLTIAARLAHSDLRGLMFPAPDAQARERAAIALERPDKSILAVFTIEYALAQLWMSWGVKPAAYIGHSLGEYVAACLAGVMSLDSALAIVAKRGEIFLRMPEGRMLSAALSEDACALPLPENVSIAAVNAPELTVVSGTVDAIAALHESLLRDGVEARPLHIEVAAHSPMLEPFLDEFRRFVAAVQLASGDAAIHFESHRRLVRSEGSRDGGLLDASLARHGAFLAGAGDGARRRPEVSARSGPGSHADHARAPASRRRTGAGRDRVTARGARQARVGRAYVLEGLGVLWTQGAAIDWTAFYGGQTRRRVELPTYAFDHEPHWIAPGLMREFESASADASDAAPASAINELRTLRPGPIAGAGCPCPRRRLCRQRRRR